jgi:hypothetical protein
MSNRYSAAAVAAPATASGSQKSVTVRENMENSSARVGTYGIRGVISSLTSAHVKNCRNAR